MQQPVKSIKCQQKVLASLTEHWGDLSRMASLLGRPVPDTRGIFSHPTTKGCSTATDVAGVGTRPPATQPKKALQQLYAKLKTCLKCYE